MTGKFRKNDRVVEHVYGWGEVVWAGAESVMVIFTSVGTAVYRHDGRRTEFDFAPSLLTADEAQRFGYASNTMKQV